MRCAYVLLILAGALRISLFSAILFIRWCPWHLMVAQCHNLPCLFEVLPSVGFYFYCGSVGDVLAAMCAQQAGEDQDNHPSSHATAHCSQPSGLCCDAFVFLPLSTSLYFSPVLFNEERFLTCRQNLA